MQYAVVAALNGDRSHQVAFRQALAERARITTESLNAIPGMRCVAPRAAFYAMPLVSLPPGRTDEDYVLALLRETGILCVYGSGFGVPPEAGSFRIVFLANPDELAIDLRGHRRLHAATICSRRRRARDSSTDSPRALIRYALVGARADRRARLGAVPQCATRCCSSTSARSSPSACRRSSMRIERKRAQARQRGCRAGRRSSSSTSASSASSSRFGVLVIPPLVDAGARPRGGASATCCTRDSSG